MELARPYPMLLLLVFYEEIWAGGEHLHLKRRNRPPSAPNDACMELKSHIDAACWSDTSVMLLPEVVNS